MTPHSTHQGSNMHWHGSMTKPWHHNLIIYVHWFADLNTWELVPSWLPDHNPCWHIQCRSWILQCLAHGKVLCQFKIWPSMESKPEAKKAAVHHIADLIIASSCMYDPAPHMTQAWPATSMMPRSLTALWMQGRWPKEALQVFMYSHS